jgi:endonuclease G
MAAKKRAPKKKNAVRKRSASRKRGQSQQPRRSLLRTLVLALTLGIGALAAVYYFGSFELRGHMERSALRAINAVRCPEATPRPIVTVLNSLYDRIPGSQGLEVEGGELGHEESALIAGVPLSESPIRVLHNHSYINLYDERQRHSRGVAFRLNPDQRHNAKVPQQFVADPRVRHEHVRDLQFGKWAPQPIAPAAALAQTFGEVGANEAHLVTNLTPMADDLAHGLWQRLIQELTVSYPKRFGEIWIYAGPVTRLHSAKLASGMSLPDSFYAIALDLTATGALRAIAFHIPHDADDGPLRNYITSIAHIEQLTGLQFLPEVDYHAREVLGTAISPQLW